MVIPEFWLVLHGRKLPRLVATVSAYPDVERLRWAKYPESAVYGVPVVAPLFEVRASSVRDFPKDADCLVRVLSGFGSDGYRHLFGCE
ncbi:hypothetical protein GCM10023152_18610 [Agromyces bauzanensis]|uniref:Uncharacterized protein n=1 Tax=Agromyces bauzanensis TaxID=1308924 RepID=A0A917PGQ8_9MICO|nr:hypothetical protein GCM10011372_13670 [Agromyces bauzanensis]